MIVELHLSNGEVFYIHTDSNHDPVDTWLRWWWWPGNSRGPMLVSTTRTYGDGEYAWINPQQIASARELH